MVKSEVERTYFDDLNNHAPSGLVKGNMYVLGSGKVMKNHVWPFVSTI